MDLPMAAKKTRKPTKKTGSKAAKPKPKAKALSKKAAAKPKTKPRAAVSSAKAKAKALTKKAAKPARPSKAKPAKAKPAKAKPAKVKSAKAAKVQPAKPAKAAKVKPAKKVARATERKLARKVEKAPRAVKAGVAKKAPKAAARPLKKEAKVEKAARKVERAPERKTKAVEVPRPRPSAGRDIPAAKGSRSAAPEARPSGKGIPAARPSKAGDRRSSPGIPAPGKSRGSQPPSRASSRPAPLREPPARLVSIPLPILQPPKRPSIEERSAQIEGRLTAASIEFRRRYEESLDMSWIYHDSALEGVVYTFEELRTALSGQAPPMTDSSLQPTYDDIRRHKEAIEHVRLLGQKKKEPVTVDDIKKIYLILHPEEGDIKTVKYRKDVPQHRLYFHEYALPDKIAYKVRQIVEWLNDPETRKTRNGIRIAARAHYDLLRVYPFPTDSGKVSRLFMNLLLIRSGLPPSIIHSTERQRYYEALKGSATTVLQMVQEAVENALASVEKLLDEYETRKRAFVS